MLKKFFFLIFFISKLCFSQSLTIEHINSIDELDINGTLDEKIWSTVDSISLKMVEPNEGIISSFPTIIKILSDNSNLIVGVMCFDPEPDKIISYSKSRDSYFSNEDRIKFIFDTYQDKRNGYIFGVNPTGTRYDALVSNFGEDENPSWDGYWIAKTKINSSGWSAEIVIPVKDLSFGNELKEWGFNIERNIQRFLEIDRWAGIKRDYSVSQVAQAGKLTGIPKFNVGIGLISKFSGITETNKIHGQKRSTGLDYSLDFTKKITSEITSQLTINTDFAETEVDTRQSNLTRFPLFFPEKRTFFLEGIDMFDFGIGLNSDVIPFFSRRIGLYSEKKVPVIFGAKLNGRFDNTNFGALVTRTDNLNGIVPTSTMSVLRLKQNIFKESSIGLIGTFGDPSGKQNIWLAGGDFVYKTSAFLDNKNFLYGIWGLYDNNPALSGDKTALGLKIDYPNDMLDMALTVKRIGDSFDPSLGFVPRRGVVMYSLGADYMPRPDFLSIRQFFFESSFSLVTKLNSQWESWRIFTAPIHFLLESGDRFEFNIAPQGEILPEDFEIEDGVVIKNGTYDWFRYRLEFESASKRIINGQATYWFGSFYDGDLDQIEINLNLRPINNLDIGINIEKNIGNLPSGKIDQLLYGTKLQYSFTPDFELSSFIQYDNDSQSFGTNTRFRWTFDMLGDLFVVYNYNLNKLQNGYWQFDSNQLIIKLSCGLWF